MARCRYCNWTPHDESAHTGPRCSRGHPLERVGEYVYGERRICKACQRDCSRRYREKNLERERARLRAYHRAHHPKRPS